MDKEIAQSNNSTQRKNGKLPSCEPCRRSKQSCDHARPICGRCQKRRRPADCIYHSSPVIGQKRDANGSAVRSTSLLSNSSSTADLSTPTKNHYVSKRSSTMEHEIGHLPTSGHVHKPSSEAARITGDMPQGYLGPTSYYAVFRENEVVPSVMDDRTENSATPSGDMGESKNGIVCDLESENHVKDGVAILSRLPDYDTCRRLHGRFYEFGDICLHTQSMQKCHQSLWDTYGDILKAPRQAEKLEALSRQLCRNAMTQIPPTKNTEEWVKSFCGENLRWEHIGIFFTAYGHGITSLPEWDALFSVSDTSNKKALGNKMKECAESCIALVNHIDCPNDFVVALMLDTYLMQSHYDGDADQELWRRYGSLAALLTQLGMHREPDVRYAPSWNMAASSLVQECRRRLYCAVYVADKQLATFMGRPPTVSRRYATTKMPLDLTDAQLMASEEELESSKTLLNSKGWSKSEAIFPSRICRAWYLMALIRDEILELTLGPPIHDIHSRREQLKAHLEAEYACIPSVLHYVKDEVKPGTNPAKFSIQISLYQEYLINRFLLNRLPDHDSRQVKQDLIDTAQEILASILTLCAARDILTDYSLCIVWNIAYSGIPAAATLSVELLKQSRPSNEWRPQLPRADTIQSLSQFLGCLDWVRPSDGNYSLCVRMRKVIKKVLDQALELPHMSPLSVQTAANLDAHSSTNNVKSAQIPEQDLSTFLGPEQDPDFLDWLNSVDWTRDMLQDSWT